MEKLELSYTDVELEHGTPTLENSFLKKNLNIILPNDLAIPFLGIFLREMKTQVEIKTRTQLLIVVLVIIAKKLKTTQMFVNW